jgi:hypothetical protein
VENNETDKRQIDRFKETARDLGADEDEAAFKAKLGVIAQQKPLATDARATGAKKYPRK